MVTVRSTLAVHLSEELLKVLDEMYPERCPQIQHSEREIWLRAGQRSVVNTLRSVLQEASENVLQYNIAG